MIYKYTVSWTGLYAGGFDDNPVSLIAFPAVLTAEAALAMIAIRLSVMYHPSLRSTWGGYTREQPLTRGLACGYVLMEIALWSTAAASGVQRYV